MSPTRTLVRRRVRRRGAALLEGIVALALLVLGMAIVGGQIRSGVRMVRETEDLGRAIMMARSKLAQVDMGLIPPEEIVEGNFGRVMPGHSWRATLLPTQTEEVFLLKLEVLEGLLDAPFDDEREDESEEEELDEELRGDLEPRVVHTAYTLRITPVTVDLQRDFGLTEEQVADLGGGGALPFDPSQPFNPADLLTLPLDELLELIPALLAAFGGQLGGRFGDLANLSPEDLKEALRSLGTDKADELLGDDSTAGSEGGETTEVGEAQEGRGEVGRSPDDAPTVEDLEALLRERERGRRPKR